MCVGVDSACHTHVYLVLLHMLERWRGGHPGIPPPPPPPKFWNSWVPRRMYVTPTTTTTPQKHSVWTPAPDVVVCSVVNMKLRAQLQWINSQLSKDNYPKTTTNYTSIFNYMCTYMFPDDKTTDLQLCLLQVIQLFWCPTWWWHYVVALVNMVLQPPTFVYVNCSCIHTSCMYQAYILSYVNLWWQLCCSLLKLANRAVRQSSCCSHMLASCNEPI